jgi:hypothetical protein
VILTQIAMELIFHSFSFGNKEMMDFYLLF